MAISENQLNAIKEGVEKSKSGRQIAKDIGIAEATVRRTIKKYDLKQDKLKTLAKKEVGIIISKQEVVKEEAEIKDAAIHLDQEKDALSKKKIHLTKKVKANYIIENDINKQKDALTKEEMTQYETIKYNETQQSNIIFGGLQEAAILMRDTMQKGTSTKVMMQGHGMGVSSPIDVEVALSTKEIQNGIDGLTKAGIAMGVIQPPGMDKSSLLGGSVTKYTIDLSAADE